MLEGLMRNERRSPEMEKGGGYGMSVQIVGQSVITRCRIASGGRGEKEFKEEERGKRQNQETGGACS
jgi:hypothetical protein